MPPSHTLSGQISNATQAREGRGSNSQAGQGEDSHAVRELQNKALPQPAAHPKAYSPGLSSTVCTGYVRDTGQARTDARKQTARKTECLSSDYAKLFPHTQEVVYLWLNIIPYTYYK